MCGIAGFLSNEVWKQDSDLSWIEEISTSLSRIPAGSSEIVKLRDPVDSLIKRFDQLMEFSFHFELVSSPGFFSRVENLANLLEKALDRISTAPPSEEIEALRQDIGDFIWQFRAEVLKNVARTNELITPKLLEKSANRAQRFVAWSIERVLENIDRLEVRGRDSAGISVQCLVDKDSLMQRISATGKERVLGKRSRVENGVKISFQGMELGPRGFVLTFVYKVANLVGHLGDNTRLIRDVVRNDDELWKIAAFTQNINIIAHTRWASNGIISLANCHPVDGELYEKENIESIADKDAQFVLNGDVDNYHDLVENVVHSRGYQIEPSVTTDAKILPVFYRLGTSLSQPNVKRFGELMNSCEGSLAIVMQHPMFPDELVMGQKGSGQSLFVGEPLDGFILASEVYGLAAWTRKCLALSGLE
ncbi:MAG: glutamine--fructose-6-phosphate aminotransferase, partial [Deltaproteobacteria bacterium]|nr:glutamine--fructose-6-phosphate aminotransferase [Deltaproteobacteria bacterium]